jgi:hypothetical protein
MCPFCLATAAYVVAGAVSTVSFTTLAFKMSGRKNTKNESTARITEGRTQDVKIHER